MIDVALDREVDAVVIGAGPNGLIAANLLADAGWSVLVLEAQDRPGGAVRTSDLTAPGFRNDVFSAFYPLAAVSPVFADLGLEDHGLRWTRSPQVLAHPRLGRPAAVVHPDIDETVECLEAQAPGDGTAYRVLIEHMASLSDPLLGALLRPFPPVRSGARLLARTRVAGTKDLARLALVPLRRFAQETFTGDGARLLLAGCALHADLTPEAAGGALFGWLMLGLAQTVGFPVPVGGAERITDALVSRLNAAGGRVRCGQRVGRVLVQGGRAVGVVTANGTSVRVRRAVVADCDASRLYADLVGLDELPPSIAARLQLVQRSAATVKVDWALSSPVPWTDSTIAGSGTVHIADSLDELTMTAAQMSVGKVPADPFVLIGQMTTADSTRSPEGTEALWAYTHVPQGVVDDPCALVDRMEQRIEQHAPGFCERVLARHVMGPGDMEAANENLVGGDISGGTTQLHQQLVFRPFDGWARAETPIDGLYLGSASAHPGGGVHGACGANAARAALLHHRLARLKPWSPPR